MTDRPILFSGPMVRAILEGRKTQTRRVLKPQPEPGAHIFSIGDDWYQQTRNGPGSDCVEVDSLRVPYAGGDRLWVRETWKPHSSWATTKPSEIPVSNIFYRADDKYAPSNTPWRVAIHMPRWASRLTLTVTEVRVQRLQEISIADAEAEGVFRHVAEHSLDKVFRSERGETAVRYFRELWESLHDPGSWAENPWVCALTFTVAQRNIDMDSKHD
jgi:hypothetical protein